MDPMKDPDVIRAQAVWEASAKATREAEIAYVSTVLRVAGSREAAFSVLGWERRTGFRRLRELGLSDSRDLGPSPKKARKPAPRPGH